MCAMVDGLCLCSGDNEGAMAQEKIDYSILSDGTNNGSTVDLTVTYDPSQMNADGSYTITDASGTYTVLLPSNSSSTDQITGLGNLGGQDQHLFINNDPAIHPIFDFHGISFAIDNAGDTLDNSGSVNFYDLNGPKDGSTPLDTPFYKEDSDSRNGTVSLFETAVPCFATGTLIRTVDGDVPVEALSLRDIVVMSSGRGASVRWIGHRTVDFRRHSGRHEAHPIRISAHAFGMNSPARDLFASPGHAICVDVLGEVLIPAGALVNGSTIRQVEVEKVTYWHIELESHAVILAENLPCESYLEMGNRGFFAESGLVELDANPDADPAWNSHAGFCRPFHACGKLVEAARERLRQRALSLGWTVETQGSLGGVSAMSA